MERSWGAGTLRLERPINQSDQEGFRAVEEKGDEAEGGEDILLK